MTEEGREPVADEPVADELMSVAVRPERGLRVVRVEYANPLDPDARVEIRESLVEARRVRDVDTRRPPVARVETEAEPRVPVDGVGESGELGDRAADGAAGASCVLHAQPEVVGRELEELA